MASSHKLRVTVPRTEHELLGNYCVISKSDYKLFHACLSVSMEQLGSHWTYFDEISYLSIFRKSV